MLSTWTDLELSQYVGSDYSLVLLKIDTPDPNNHGGVSIRTNGETKTIGWEATATAFGAGTSAVQTGNSVGYVLLETHQNGLLEMKAFTGGT